MRGVAGQRGAAESPAIDRILVDHRIFENLVGITNHLRHVEPVETPVFVERKEIGQVPGLVPVVLLGGVVLDLGHPVDQLVAGAVHIIDDRIYDDLAGKDRANPHIGPAAEDGLAPCHSAPGIDAGKGDLVVRIKLLAQSRIDAVAGNDGIGTHAFARFSSAGLLEVDIRAALILLNADAFAVRQYRVLAEPFLYSLVEDNVQPAAMDSDFRKGVSGEFASRLAVNQLPE